MNLVLDDACEIHLKKNTRTPLGNFCLFYGQNFELYSNISNLRPYSNERRQHHIDTTGS